MAKTNDFRKSPASESDEHYAHGEFTGAPEPEIDLERGQKYGDQLEQGNPKFKALMDKLRSAAKALGKAICICFAVILTDYSLRR